MNLEAKMSKSYNEVVKSIEKSNLRLDWTVDTTDLAS